MEKIYHVACSLFVATALVACNSSPLKYEKSEGIKVNSEFDQSVKITQSEPVDSGKSSGAELKSNEQSAVAKAEATSAGKAKSGKSKGKKTSKTATTEVPIVEVNANSGSKVNPKVISKGGSSIGSKSAKSGKSDLSQNSKKEDQSAAGIGPVKVAAAKHEPDLEDAVGFIGRRPIKDPFAVGENVVHEVSYFGVTAGHLALKVEPFVNVNGRKSYTFATEIKTVGTFASFYTADDRAETLVDYETLVPSVFALHVKESGQLREAKAHFDANTLKATYWEHKYTKKDGDEEKKLQWDILEYSQNVFSAIFYMRVFQWEIGKENSFRVADDGENIVFKAKALRKELLKTDAGEFSCIVVKPEITVKGAFRPVGDIYVWITDDDRKLVLRIESKIKIGTLVSEAVKIERGNP